MTEKTIDVTALGELLIDFTCNGVSPQGNPLYEANPGGGRAPQKQHPAETTAPAETAPEEDSTEETTEPESTEETIPPNEESGDDDDDSEETDETRGPGSDLTSAGHPNNQTDPSDHQTSEPSRPAEKEPVTDSSTGIQNGSETPPVPAPSVAQPDAEPVGPGV